MRAKVKNTSRANQGIYTDDGLVHLDPGQQRTLTIAPDYVDRAKKLPFFEIKEIGALDRDEDGHDGGSKPVEPPALSGLTKADLLDLATKEGAEVEEGATKADIIAAIELKREADAQA